MERNLVPNLLTNYFTTLILDLHTILLEVMSSIVANFFKSNLTLSSYFFFECSFLFAPLTMIVSILLTKTTTTGSLLYTCPSRNNFLSLNFLMIDPLPTNI